MAELSRYHAVGTGRIHKSVPMSKELSDHINAVLKVMPNTDFAKATREMWTRLIITHQGQSFFGEMPEMKQVDHVVHDYYGDMYPYWTKRRRQ